MWKAYLKVIARKDSPAAIHVLDRFHIVSHVGKALDQVRASEAGDEALGGLGAAAQPSAAGACSSARRT